VRDSCYCEKLAEAQQDCKKRGLQMMEWTFFLRLLLSSRVISRKHRWLCALHRFRGNNETLLT
jgi:hypothetical protein